jgi:replicative DNA helicase
VTANSELEADPRLSDIVLGRAQKQINDLATFQTGDEYDHQKSVFEYMKSVEQKYLDPKKDKIAGFRIGIPRIDNTINGFQRGLSYIVGGLKKTGKSRFAVNVAAKLLEQSLGGVIFSMEMPVNKIHACFIANAAKIDTSNLHSGNMTPEQIGMFTHHANRYLGQELYISKQSAISPDVVRARIRAQRVKHAVDFVVVDYIQRMRIYGMESRTKEVERCALDLADIGRDENVIMIILSQISGEYEKMPGRNIPIYAFFKESQAIVESADVVIALYDPNRGKEQEGIEDFKNLKSVIIQRDGKGDIFCDLQARLQYAQFEETDETHKQEEKPWIPE